MTLPYESRDVIYRVLNAAKPGHSVDPVSAVTKKGKTLLGVKHPIKKFGIGWCIHHRMAADNPKGHLIGLNHQNLFLTVQPTDVEYPNNAVM